MVATSSTTTTRAPGAGRLEPNVIAPCRFVARSAAVRPAWSCTCARKPQCGDERRGDAGRAQRRDRGPSRPGQGVVPPAPGHARATRHRHQHDRPAFRRCLTFHPAGTPAADATAGTPAAAASTAEARAAPRGRASPVRPCSLCASTSARTGSGVVGHRVRRRRARACRDEQRRTQRRHAVGAHHGPAGRAAAGAGGGQDEVRHDLQSAGQAGGRGRMGLRGRVEVRTGAASPGVAAPIGTAHPNRGRRPEVRRCGEPSARVPRRAAGADPGPGAARAQPEESASSTCRRACPAGARRRPT